MQTNLLKVKKIGGFNVYRKNNYFYLLIMLVIASSLLIVGCTNDGGVAKDKVLKIGQAPYDYEVPFVEITKQIATEQGYRVEVVKGDVGFMFLSLVQGDIDIWSGVWLPSIHDTYQGKYGDQYELGSAIFENAPVGWAVPEYMGIDSIADFQGNEELVDKKLTGFEPGSGMMLLSKEVIEGYDLDMEIIPGTLAAMMAEVDYAITHEKPIVFLGWRPHTMMRKYDVKVLEDPKGYWDLDSELWGMRLGLAEEAPDIHNYCQNFKMSLDETEKFLFDYQEDGKKVEDLAKEWIENNRSQIDSWLEG